MDQILKAHLDILVADLYDEDDVLVVLYGDEGAGKSVLESQIADYVATKTKTKLEIRKQVHFHGEKFIESGLTGSRRMVNCLDESRRTLNKMRMTASIHQKFMNYLAECRSQCQFNLILLPSYFDLDEDVAIRRCKLVIKVIKRRDPETKKLVRGIFQIINTKDKSILKKLYKKKLENIPKQFISYQGRFGKKMGWDEEEYKKYKEEEKKINFLETEQDRLNIKFTNRDFIDLKYLITHIPNPYDRDMGGETNKYNSFNKLKKKILAVKTDES